MLIAHYSPFLFSFFFFLFLCLFYFLFFLMNTKKLLIGAGVGIFTLGTLSFAAVNAKNIRTPDTTVRTAIESNNYAALSEAAKTKISQEQFTHMVTKNTQHEAVEKSLVAGDYTAFKNAMIAQIPTETEFQAMVTAHKARVEAQTKIETAVKNNDFTAFKTAMEAQRAQMDANHPNGDSADRPASTDTKLQEHFTKLVEYYKTNGKLPEMGKGFGPMGGGKMGDKWMRGGHDRQGK
jgi:hypothetical protein